MSWRRRPPFGERPTAGLTRALRALLLVVAGLLSTATVPGAALRPVEQHYLAAGPWAVSVQPDAGCCDSAGFGYAVWAPTELGRDGALHPVITWGNGTGAPPEAYDHLLRHWASWGFVVVASRQPMAASGQEMLDAARWMRAQHDLAGSPYHQRLAVDRIASAGHSQGAVGAMNALHHGEGLVQAMIAFALPAQSYCPQMSHCADPAALRSGAVLYVNGALDVNVSPSRQPKDVSGLQSNLAFFKATPGEVDKAWGTIAGSGHSDLMGQPACSGGDPDCVAGVWNYLGYPTAWLMDQLRDDAEAHAAFVPDGGEFFLPRGQWRHQRSNLR